MGLVSRLKRGGKWHAQRKWDAKNRHKRRAQHDVRNAIREGRLRRQRCQKCGTPNADAHHSDYAQTTKVAWLCRKCHSKHLPQARR